jgi:ankyrin repeat protein
MSQGMQPSWHQKFKWKAEDYFDDASVVALCRAIEADDIPEIDRSLAAGADVNAKGKWNMTPLLWAFPDNKLHRFKHLLERGANPNVIVESDFGTRSAILPGEAVTHMASESSFPGYFDAVFENGGDFNLPKKTLALGKNQTPLFCVIKGSAPDKKQKVMLLIQKGANINHKDLGGTTPVMTAVGWGGRFDIALMLLEAGADYRIYQENQAQKLIHVVARQDSRLSSYNAHQKADYQKVVEWLRKRGESVDSARADIKRWDSWSRTTGEYRRKMDAEIAERKAREARQKAAAKKPDDQKR